MEQAVEPERDNGNEPPPARCIVPHSWIGNDVGEEVDREEGAETVIVNDGRRVGLPAPNAHVVVHGLENVAGADCDLRVGWDSPAVDQTHPIKPGAVDGERGRLLFVRKIFVATKCGRVGVLKLLQSTTAPFPSGLWRQCAELYFAVTFEVKSVGRLGMNSRRSGNCHEAPNGHNRGDGDASYTIHVCSSSWIERPSSSWFYRRGNCFTVGTSRLAEQVGYPRENGDGWL